MLTGKLSSGSPSDRAAAAEKLESFLPDSSRALHGALAAQEVNVRLAAAVALARSKDDLPAAVSTLHSVAADVGHADAVFAAAQKAGIAASEFRPEIDAAVRGTDDRARVLREAVGRAVAWSGGEVFAIGLKDDATTRKSAAAILTGSLPVSRSALDELEKSLSDTGREFKHTMGLVGLLVEQSRGREGRGELLARIAAVVPTLADMTRHHQAFLLLADGCRHDLDHVELAMTFVRDFSSPGTRGILAFFGAGDAGPAQIAEMKPYLATGSEQEAHYRAMAFFSKDGSAVVPELAKLLASNGGGTGYKDWELAGQGLMNAGPAGLDALASAAAEEKRPDVRKQVFTWLTERPVTDDDSVPRAMLKLLPNASVRAEAIEVIRRSGPIAGCAVGPLLDVLPAEPRALQALRYIGVRRKEDVDRLLAWSKTRPDDAVTVAECLIPVPESAIPLCREILKRDKQGRTEPISLLGEIGGAGAVPDLRPLISAKRPEVQVEALRALGRIGAPSAAAVPDIEKFLSTGGDPYAVRNALRTLAKLGPLAKSAETTVRKFLGGKDTFLAAQAKIALATMGIEKLTGADFKALLSARGPELAYVGESLWDLPGPNASLASVLREKLQKPEEFYLVALYLRHATDPKDVIWAVENFSVVSYQKPIGLDGRIINGVKAREALEIWRWESASPTLTSWDDNDLRLVEGIGKLLGESPLALKYLLRMSQSGGTLGYRALVLLQKVRRE